MAEYYTQAESDARYARSTHTHPLEELGGELTADRVVVSEAVAALFDNAYFVDEAFESVSDQLGGKAPSNHTHTGYASASHSHDGYASSDHTHTGYAASTHTHEGFASSDHTHTGFAAATHTHDGYAAEAHTHDGYAAATHTHADYMTDAEAEAAFAGANHTHTGFAAADHAHSGYAASNHGHSYNDLSDKPSIPAAYTHPASHPASMITGLAEVATTGSYEDLSDKPTIPTIPASLPANGGNADTVDNKHASDFATAGHTHTAADIGAAPATHTHTPASIGAAAAEHTHSYAPSTHTHTPASIGAANADHAHSGYAASTHTHTPASIGAAASEHSHSGYAASNHIHANYADDDHTHTAEDVGAVPSTGGTFTGPVTIKPQLLTAQILPFDGGSYSIGTSANRYYSTYLRVNPNVSSDRRFKRDIYDMDIAALAAFVDKLKVVAYNYNDDAEDAEERIGLIAQDIVAADEEIAKGCVEQDENGFYSLRTADLVYPLIAAVQLLTKRVEELEGK